MSKRAVKTGKREATGVELLRSRFVKGDAAKEKFISDERNRMDVAQSIYDARMKAGLTQEELANLVGTTKSAISRLEDSDYEGHSMNMLRRIADALGKTVRVEFV